MALKETSSSKLLLALLFLFLTTGSDGCLSGLPPFINYRGSGLLGRPPDGLQAIIPAYRFTCSGRVIQWGACFRPGANFDRYYVSYQVWRERSPGCFYLVGSNSPQGTGNNDLLTLEERCNVTSIPPGEQIRVQDGDVVGFYSDHWEELLNGRLSNTQYKSGLQILAGYNTTMYLNRLSSLQDMRESYAVGTGPGSCAALPGFSGQEVDETFMGTPVITAMIESEDINVQSHGESPGQNSSSLQAPHHVTTTTDHVTTTTDHVTTTTHYVTTTTISTVIFSISPSTTTTSSVNHSSRTSSTTSDGAASSMSASPLQSSIINSHLTMSTTPLSSADLTQTMALTEDSRDSSYSLYNSMVHVLAASLVVLFTVLMVLVAILAIAFFWKRTGRRRTQANLTTPRLEFESSELSQDRSTPDGGDDSVQGLQTEYHLLNRSQERVSVLSNGLYATSPVIGLRTKAAGEGSGNDVVKVDQEKPRLKVDSMVYNVAYGSYSSTGEGARPLKTVQPDVDSVIYNVAYGSYSNTGEGASPLKTVQPDSEQDCGGYELVSTRT